MMRQLRVYKRINQKYERIYVLYYYFLFVKYKSFIITRSLHFSQNYKFSTMIQN